jgi:hypothetical protein
LFLSRLVLYWRLVDHHLPGWRLLRRWCLNPDDLLCRHVVHRYRSIVHLDLRYLYGRFVLFGRLVDRRLPGWQIFGCPRCDIELHLPDLPFRFVLPDGGDGHTGGL